MVSFSIVFCELLLLLVVAVVADVAVVVDDDIAAVVFVSFDGNCFLFYIWLMVIYVIYVFDDCSLSLY